MHTSVSTNCKEQIRTERQNIFRLTRARKSTHVKSHEAYPYHYHLSQINRLKDQTNIKLTLEIKVQVSNTVEVFRLKVNSMYGVGAFSLVNFPFHNKFPLILLARATSFGIIVTRLAWIAHI
jgi:hypothetical protein